MQSTLRNSSLSIAGTAELSVRNFFKILGVEKIFLRSSTDFRLQRTIQALIG